ncbi:MAG: SDR family NAD(P)-dependent oxidoreductase [Candidatus Kariarchaeaceae archaeon]
MSDPKYVVVTGANSGIGFAISQHLSSKGYNVIATARNQTDLNNLASINNVTSYYLDVTQPESIENFKNHLDSSNIRIYALINNAGVIIIGSTFLVTNEEIANIFNTNVFGIMKLTNTLLPNLINSKGRIINISSDSGLTVFPSSTIYCMTKHALEAYSEGIRAELKSFDVSVSLIEPGNHKSAIINNYLKNYNSERNINFPEFEENHKSIIDSAKAWGSTEGRDPYLVARSVLTSLEDENPKLRYLVVNEEEHNYLINELFDKINNINQTNEFSFNLTELIDKLEFSYDLMNN